MVNWRRLARDRKCAASIDAGAKNAILTSFETALSLVRIATAVELDHAVNGDSTVAAIDGQARLVQRVQPELTADFVVADNQVINGPPAIAVVAVERRNQTLRQMDIGTLTWIDTLMVA